jgi:hypothetical protein
MRTRFLNAPLSLDEALRISHQEPEPERIPEADLEAELRTGALATALPTYGASNIALHLSSRIIFIHLTDRLGANPSRVQPEDEFGAADCPPVAKEMQAVPGTQTNDQNVAAAKARNAARNAAVSLARDSGAQIVTRPAFPGSETRVHDVEPIAGMRAARVLELAARRTDLSYIRDAREAGLAPTAASE